MTNIEAGSQRIRRLPDKPIVGETYPNAGGIYKVDRYDAERDLAWVHRPKDGWKCCAHGPALYDGRDRALSCSGITAPGASSVLTIATKGGERYDPPRLGAGSGNQLYSSQHSGRDHQTLVKKEQCKSILSISRNALRGRHCEMTYTV